MQVITEEMLEPRFLDKDRKIRNSFNVHEAFRIFPAEQRCDIVCMVSDVNGKGTERHALKVDIYLGYTFLDA